MPLKKNNIIKSSSLALVMVFLFTLFNYIKLYKKFDTFKQKVEVEEKITQNQLDVILKKYDSLKVFSKSVSSNPDLGALVVGKKIISDEKVNADENMVSNQIKNLRYSILENDKEVLRLNQKNAEDKKVLLKLESIEQPDVKLKIDKLSAINIKARGVKILTDKFSRIKDKQIQQLRVCFTIEGNEFVKKGDKKFYVQVVNPKNQIISSENTFIEFKDVKLMYSAKVESFYNQVDTDICTYIDLENNKTIKGKYRINVYNQFSKIGTAFFEHN